MTKLRAAGIRRPAKLKGKMRASGIIKKAICLILAAAAALTLVSCKREPAKRTAVFYDYFDTVITLTAYTDDADDLKTKRGIVRLMPGEEKTYVHVIAFS